MVPTNLAFNKLYKMTVLVPVRGILYKIKILKSRVHAKFALLKFPTNIHLLELSASVSHSDLILYFGRLVFLKP